MKKLKLIFEYFLLVIFSLVLCFQLKAQNPKFSQKTDTLSSVTYKTKYTPIPFAAYSPDTRLMFGGFLLRQFKPTHAGEETRPSNIQLTATYTLNQQINLSSSYTVLYPNERWMWKGEIGFKKFPKSYWGVGPSTLEEDELKVNYQMIKLKQTILKRIAENTYLGPQLRFSHMYKVSFKDLNDQPIAPPDVTGTEGSTNVGLGIVFNWDKRDNILTPTQNHYLELSTLFYSSLFQSEYGFQSYKIDARKYFSLKESGKEVLAFQALMLFTSGDVPFEEMGMVGGEIIMRGYFEGRYRDKNSIQAQMEYRRLISGRFAAVAFGAVGNVMPRLRDLKTDSTKWTLGAGLRYKL